MLYAFMLIDRLDSAALRERVRPDHKAYLAQVAERIAFAGPLLADDAQTMLGSLLVIDFANRESALAWLEHEPFTRAGVYGSAQVHAFRNPVGTARRVCAGSHRRRLTGPACARGGALQARAPATSRAAPVHRPKSG